MKYIISGTNRPGSVSLQVAKVIKNIHLQLGQEYEICDLQQIDFSQLNGTQYGSNKPLEIENWVHKINVSEALVIVVPEYNGSMPGILKYFIDHWTFPDSFEHRPICFVGLGGRFGGLRTVEHLQQVFGYRSSYIFPERVFLINCWQIVKEGKIIDSFVMGLLEQQALLFNKFVKGLVSEHLSTNHIQKKK